MGFSSRTTNDDDEEEGLGKENLVQLKFVFKHFLYLIQNNFTVSLFCIVCLSIVLNQLCVCHPCHCLFTINEYIINIYIL